jgi:hypothetical protein
MGKVEKIQKGGEAMTASERERLNKILENNRTPQEWTGVEPVALVPYSDLRLLLRVAAEVDKNPEVDHEIMYFRG